MSWWERLLAGPAGRWVRIVVALAVVLGALLALPYAHLSHLWPVPVLLLVGAVELQELLRLLGQVRRLVLELERDGPAEAVALRLDALDFAEGGFVYDG